MIGAGITGVALVRHLVARGVDVWCLERESLAAGASGRNAGFLLSGVAESYAAAVRSLGRRVAAEVWDFTAANHAHLVELTGGRPCGHARRGSLTVPASAEEARELGEAAELLAEDGIAAELLTHSSLLVPGDGEIVPTLAVAAIAAAVADRICERTPVAAVASSPSGARVLLEGGHEVAAGAVVLATNGHTRLLCPSAPIRPVRAQMLATAPDPRRIADRPVYSEWGYRYWRQLEDGRLVLGGCRNRNLATEDVDDSVPTDPVQRHLDAEATRLGVTAPVTHRWAGTMGFSPDGLPLVGPLPGHPGLHLCGGYSGHGMGFAVEAAAALAASMIDSVAPPSWMGTARFR